MSSPKDNGAEERLAVVHAIRDVGMVAALVGAGVALGLADRGELAATALGGALGLAVPSKAGRGGGLGGAAALGLALAASALVSGCSGAMPAKPILHTACDVARASCAVVEGACSAMSAGGETP